MNLDCAGFQVPRLSFAFFSLFMLQGVADSFALRKVDQPMCSLVCDSMNLAPFVLSFVSIFLVRYYHPSVHC